MTFHNELRGAARQERGPRVLAQIVREADAKAATALGPEYAAAHIAVRDLIESRPSVLAATPGDFRDARGRIADAIDAAVADLDDEEGLRKGMASVAAKLRDPAHRLSDLRKLTPHMIRWHKPDRRLAGHLAGIGKLTILLAAVEEKAARE